MCIQLMLIQMVKITLGYLFARVETDLLSLGVPALSEQCGGAGFDNSRNKHLPFLFQAHTCSGHVFQHPHFS